MEGSRGVWTSSKRRFEAPRFSCMNLEDPDLLDELETRTDIAPCPGKLGKSPLRSLERILFQYHVFHIVRDKLSHDPMVQRRVVVVAIGEPRMEPDGEVEGAPCPRARTLR